MTVFVDTSVLYASVVRSDGRHDDARRILELIRDEDPIVTDHVLVETWILLEGRIGKGIADRFWLGLRHSPVTIEHVTAEDLVRAEAITEMWGDQDFDVVDCTSFAVMERVGCYRAATFDKDFAIYRSGPRRARAFEIVRP